MDECAAAEGSEAHSKEALTLRMEQVLENRWRENRGEHTDNLAVVDDR